METEGLTNLLKDTILCDGLSILSYNLSTHTTHVEVANKEHNKLLELLKDDLFNKLIEAKLIAPNCANTAKEFMQKIDAGAQSGKCDLFVRESVDKPYAWFRFAFQTSESITMIAVKNEDDDVQKKLISSLYNKQVVDGMDHGNSYFIVNIDDETIYNSCGKLAIKTKDFKEQVNYIASMCNEMSQQLRQVLGKNNLLKMSDKNNVVELMDVLIHNIDGISKWFKIEAVYIKHPLSGANFAQIIFVDVDNSHRESEDIKYYATHDELTDLLNKHTFTNMAIEKIDKLYNNFWKALIFIDIDNFKKINDNLGHIIGDRVLHGVAAGIKKSFRKNDLVGRVGGDEFMVLFSVPNLYTLYNRLNLLNTNIKQNAQIENLSVSMGIVLFFDKDNDFDKLYYQADKAMYHAKQMGKDCFYVVDQHKNAFLNDVLSKFENTKIAAMMKLKTNDFIFGHYNDDKIVIDYITPKLLGNAFDDKNINKIENISEFVTRKDFAQLNKLIDESFGKGKSQGVINLKGNSYNVSVMVDKDDVVIGLQNVDNN